MKPGGKRVGAVSPVGPDRTTPIGRADRKAALALCFFGLAALMLGVIHLDPKLGGISPVTAMLSDYALTPGWWLWDLTLAATSLGSILVVLALRESAILPAGSATVWLIVWSGCVLLIAIFSKDPQGGAVTVTGKVHLYATAVSCASLPAAGLVLGRRYRRHPGWRVYARCTRWLAAGAIPLFLPFILPFAATTLLGRRMPGSFPTGLIERLMIGLDLAVLVTLGLWSRHASRPVPHTEPSQRQVALSAS